MEKIVYNVLKLLEDNNFEAYIVGGYVRDFLLNKKTKDIDICTNARPKDMMNLFNNEKITILEYGNVILEINDYKFEITTFRKDITYKDARKPVEILYIDTLDEDLLRRDFTINAICMNKDGKIIDKLNGIKDLKKRLITTIGDPDEKFKEDALRMMRAIRFASVLEFLIDEKAKKAIRNNRELLRGLSYERKKEELNKIFATKNKKYAVSLIRELELEDVLELENIDVITKTNHIIGIWAMITSKNYAFTKEEKKTISLIKELYDKDLYNSKVLYEYGIYPVDIVCDIRGLNKKKIFKLYDRLPIKDRNEINISPLEICDLFDSLGGSFIKDVYEDLEDQILTFKLKNKKEDIKRYIIKKYDIIHK